MIYGVELDEDYFENKDTRIYKNFLENAKNILNDGLQDEKISRYLREKIKDTLELIENLSKNLENNSENYHVDYTDLLDCLVEFIEEKTDLDVYFEYPDSSKPIIYLGKSMDKMNDEETLKQFKEKVRSIIKEIFCTLSDSEFSIIERCWYN